MFKDISVLFSEGNWSEGVNFDALLNAIVEFVKNLVSFEFGISVDEILK